MAMQGASNPAYDVSRLGQTNLSGDVRSLFLKLYAGEVLTSFEATNIMMPLMRTRTISKGKSASFPMLGRTTAEYHTPEMKSRAARYALLSVSSRLTIC